MGLLVWLRPAATGHACSFLGAISTGTEYWREYSSTLPKTGAMRSSYFDTNRERLSGMFDGRNRIGWTVVNNMAVAELSLSATACADLGAEDLDRYGITKICAGFLPWSRHVARELALTASLGPGRRGE
jgi:hypothetical protein